MLNSIKFKLFIWFFFSFSILFIGFNIYLYEQQKAGLFSTVDLFLESKTKFFAGLIEIYHDGKIDFEPTEEKKGFHRKATLYDVPLSGHYYQIFFEDQTILARSPSLEGSSLPVSFERVKKETQYFETVKGPAGESLRIITRKVSLENPTTPESPLTFFIQTAETLEGVESHLATLKRRYWLSTPILIGISGIGGFWISLISLRPLKAFSEEVSAITENKLDTRINAKKANQELQELALSFNATLDRLEKVFNQQKQFIANASHELRTPVSVIKSHCEIPLRKERRPEEYIKTLETIHHHTREMEKLIEKLLTLSRYEQKEISLKMEKVDIQNTLEKVCSMLSPLAEKNGIKMVRSIRTQAPYVRGHRESLFEVFTILIDNALKYTPSGGEVHIEMKEETRQIITDISDTGIGISREDLPHIFDRFYRVDRSRSKFWEGKKMFPGGFGLGLSIANEIIGSHHGGKLEVESQMGSGTTFRIYLKKWEK